MAGHFKPAGVVHKSLPSAAVSKAQTLSLLQRSLRAASSRSTQWSSWKKRSTVLFLATKTRIMERLKKAVWYPTHLLERLNACYAEAELCVTSILAVFNHFQPRALQVWVFTHIPRLSVTALQGSPWSLQTENSAQPITYVLPCSTLLMISTVLSLLSISLLHFRRVFVV